MEEFSEEKYLEEKDNEWFDMLEIMYKINENIELLNKMIPDNKIELIDVDHVCDENVLKYNFPWLMESIMKACFNHGYKKAIADGMTTVMYNK